MTTNATRRIYTPRDLCSMFGVNRTTLWRWVQAGRIDAPIVLSPNRTGWPVEYIETWLATRPRSVSAPGSAAQVIEAHA